MEMRLNNRFRRVARKFGGGLKSVLMGGGVAGAIAALGGGLVLKVLNPLKETQEIIEKTLGRVDDITTLAEKFGTTASNMSRLFAIGEGTGTKQESLIKALDKFQAAITKARVDPNAPSSVRAFAGETDTANAFFKFTQQLRTLSLAERDIVQREVFGSRESLAIADFLQSDLVGVGREVFKGVENIAPGSVDPEADAVLEKALQGAAGLVGQNKILNAKRNFEDLVNKSDLLRPSQLTAIDASRRAEQQRENERLKNFENINAAGEALKRIEYSIEKMATTIVSTFPDLQARIMSVIDKVATAVPKFLSTMNDILSVLKGSRAIRGVKSEGE